MLLRTQALLTAPLFSTTVPNTPCACSPSDCTEPLSMRIQSHIPGISVCSREGLSRKSRDGPALKGTKTVSLSKKHMRKQPLHSRWSWRWQKWKRQGLRISHGCVAPTLRALWTSGSWFRRQGLLPRIPGIGSMWNWWSTEWNRECSVLSHIAVGWCAGRANPWHSNARAKPTMRRWVTHAVSSPKNATHWIVGNMIKPKG